MYSRIKVY